MPLKRCTDLDSERERESEIEKEEVEEIERERRKKCMFISFVASKWWYKRLILLVGLCRRSNFERTKESNEILQRNHIPTMAKAYSPKVYT